MMAVWQEIDGPLEGKQLRGLIEFFEGPADGGALLFKAMVPAHRAAFVVDHETFEGINKAAAGLRPSLVAMSEGWRYRMVLEREFEQRPSGAYQPTGRIRFRMLFTGERGPCCMEAYMTTMSELCSGDVWFCPEAEDLL